LDLRQTQRTGPGNGAGSRIIAQGTAEKPQFPRLSSAPDLIHEVIGHGGLMASPRVAELKRLAGQASRRLETPPGRDFFAKVFWFSIEFGVLYEDGELRAYGAGLLSSYSPARLSDARSIRR
jgi:phenylalanine-4-hydroxylase